MEEQKQNNKGFIPKHGGYRNLITYQKAEIIYDGTIYFTNQFSGSMTTPLIKWCKQQEVANKILLKPVWVQEHPKNLKLN